MTLTFLETRLFSVRWHKRLDSEALRRLQNELIEDSGRGDPIPGCGMLRKYRFGDQSRGKGKRGGLRVVYMHTPEVQRIDLVTVYGKDEADDLTPRELLELCRLAKLIREGALSARNPVRIQGKRNEW